METYLTHLLILEDQPDLAAQYEIYSHIALEELKKEGFVFQAEIHKAQSLNIAESVVRELGANLHFVSIDIALEKGEGGLTDPKRKSAEPSGIKFMQTLRQTGSRALAIVVSGETLMSYAIDALQKYGCIAFYQKPLNDFRKYTNAVKTALLYSWTEDRIAAFEKTFRVQDLDVAEHSWEAAIAAAQSADIDIHHFPRDLKEVIKRERETLDHYTNLPKGDTTERALRNLFGEVNSQWGDDKIQWVFLQVFISGFREFVATHNSQQKPILNQVASYLTEECEKAVRDSSSYFVGRLGFSDNTEDPCFIAFLRTDGARIDRIAEALTQKFVQDRNKFDDNFSSRGAASVLELTYRILTSDEAEDVADFAELQQWLGARA